MTDTRIERSKGGLTLAMVVEMTGYSAADIALIARTVASDASLQELAMFLHSCRQLKLDPLLRQAYLIKRKDTRTNQTRATLQVGIDGYRGLADRQGNYAGSSEPTFRGRKELTVGTTKLLVPEYAQVVTWKLVQGHRASFVGEARWDEFYPGPGQGFMWHKMPFHQLAKCAEAQSLRKGWPALLGGVEMSPDVDASGDTVMSVEELPEVAPSRPARRPLTVEDYDRIFPPDELGVQSQAPQEEPAEEPAQEPPPADTQAQLRSDLWQTNRRLGAEAAELKLRTPTLRATATVGQLQAANAELERLINRAVDESLAKAEARPKADGWADESRG